MSLLKFIGMDNDARKKVMNGDTFALALWFAEEGKTKSIAERMGIILPSRPLRTKPGILEGSIEDEEDNTNDF